MDDKLAFAILEQGLKTVKTKGYVPKSRISSSIKEIISGDHLTFRYILFTGLLAKATDQSIHPRCLQAGWNIKGAYDARSLCHGVVVPFERQRLESALGGSNEPFLNKPARYKSVELSNPVRAGKDREKLALLCKILETVKGFSAKNAFVAFCDCMFYTLERVGVRAKYAINFGSGISRRGQIINFLTVFLAKSFGGETSAVATGALLSGLESIYGSAFIVTVHPVNQAGSSSNEVSDVDAYLGEQLRYSIEVKDKKFSIYDVQHASKKVGKAGHDALIFILGPSAKIPTDYTISDLEETVFTQGVSVSFLDMTCFARSVLALIPTMTSLFFYTSLLAHCKSARVKDGTMKHLHECATELGWVVTK